MLPYCSHCRNALQLDPFRERRVLFFTNGRSTGPNAQSNNDDEDDAAENPNEGEEQTTEERENEGNGNNIENQQQEIRNDVQETTERRESVSETLATLETTKNGIESTLSRVGEMEERMKEMVEKLPGAKEIKKEALDAFANFKNALDNSLTALIIWYDQFQELNNWNSGNTHPADFLHFLNNSVFHPGHPISNDFAVITDRLDEELGNNESLEWNTIGQAEKQRYIQTANATLPINVWQDHVNEFCNLLVQDKEQMETIPDLLEKELEKVEEVMKNEKKEHAGEIRTNLGFNLVSLNNIINGGTKYCTAIGVIWKEFAERQDANVGLQLGNITKGLPFGDQIQNAMQRDLQKTDSDAKDAYTNFLKSSRVRFKDIDDLLKRNQGDANRFTAVLEYAAEKGWLYDINADEMSVFGMNISSRLPSYQDPDEYMDTLVGTNRKGESSEKARGKELVETEESIPPIIHIMNKELAKGNYWAVYGIIEVALGKGKAGHTSTWTASVILNHIRNDATAKKFFPTRVYDQLGNLGISTPLFQHVLFKFDRDKLEEWQVEGTKSNFEGAGNFAKVFSLIEEEILQENPNITEGKKLEIIGEVLACHVAKIPGSRKKISIFSDRYKDYRVAMANSPSGYDNFKNVDPDYVTPIGGGSEILLTGPETYRNMMKTESQGSAVAGDMVNLLYGTIITKYDELQKNGLTEDLRNYQQEMQDKLHATFTELIRPQKLAQFSAKRAQIKPNGEIDGDPKNMIHMPSAMVEFYRRGLLSLETLNAMQRGRDEERKTFANTVKSSLVDEGLLEGQDNDT